ncbi:hypothetical protein ACFU6I_18955 [Streptomyces sp. NPDC057486]|uniref:hypothetical protein n=1 Tax=Streptomyces sp. NPDC057486 TaxID=3346145 RepID=UPI0036C32784
MQRLAMTAGGAPNAVPRTAAKVSYASFRRGRTVTEFPPDCGAAGSSSSRSSMNGCRVRVVSPRAAAIAASSSSASPRSRMLQGSCRR